MSLRTGRKKPHPDAPRPPRVRRPLTLPPSVARAVARGAKTMHRLPVESDDHRHRPRPDDIVRIRNTDGLTICHILVSSVEQQQLGDLTFEDARREGFNTRDDFYSDWCQRHELGLSRPVVDLLERLADAPGALAANEIHPGLSPHVLGRRLHGAQRQGLAARHPSRRWDITDHAAERMIDPLDGLDLDQEVWAITFTVDVRDRPRYITPAVRPGGSDDGLGYTDQPALALVDQVDGRKPQPIEAVDEVTQARITERAGMQTEQWRALERAQRDRDLECMSLGQQLDALIDEAKRTGRPISKDIRVIERRLAALRQRAAAA